MATERACHRLGDNTFAEACFDDNSMDELIKALVEPEADEYDCKTLSITPTEWRDQIELGLRAKIEHVCETASYLYDLCFANGVEMPILLGSDHTRLQNPPEL